MPFNVDDWARQVLAEADAPRYQARIVVATEVELRRRDLAAREAEAFDAFDALEQAIDVSRSARWRLMLAAGRLRRAVRLALALRGIDG